jgi:hypothetical protein
MNISRPSASISSCTPSITRRGPPAPPRNKRTSLSDLLREERCPIKLTIFVGENSDAANKAAARQIKQLKQIVLNPMTLDKLENFEIAKDYNLDLWKPSDCAVGVQVKVDATFTDFPPSDAKFVRVVSVEPVFYQVPSADLLKVIKPDDKKSRPRNTYMWDKGDTIVLADQERIKFDRKDCREIKSALELRWKNKKFVEIRKDEGMLLWEIFGETFRNESVKALG